MSNLSRRDSVACKNRKMNQYSTPLIPFLLNTVVFLCSLALFIILESGIIPPNRNGFFCSDNSISYPLKDSTISTGMLIMINVVVSITVIVIVEQVITFENNQSETINSKKEQTWLAWILEANHLWPIRVTKVALLLTWYIMANTSVTDVIKLTVGRLRPHFMSVCNPNVNCSNGDRNYYHLEYVCENITLKEETDTRLSFPSGHASMSATVMGFVIVYVQIRCNPPERFILLKPIIYLAMVILAVWISMTRVSDFQHHLDDVIFGFLQGTLIGILGGIHATKGTATLFEPGETLQESHALIDRNTGTNSYDSNSSNVNSNHQNEVLSGDKESFRNLEDNSK